MAESTHVWIKYLELILIVGTIIILSSGTVFSAPRCQKIATITATDGGIFSMKSFNDWLYIGMFGYDYDSAQHNRRMVYRYNNRVLQSRNLTKADLVRSESICAMTVFKGWLYLGTERNGLIFRTQNGVNFQRVWKGSHKSTCSFAQDRNRILVAQQTGNAVSLSTNNGLNWTVNRTPIISKNYYRQVEFYQGRWYVFGLHRFGPPSNRTHTSFYSTDLKNWTRLNTPGRVFRTAVINNVLWASVARLPTHVGNNRIGLYRLNGNRWVKTYKATSSKWSHLSTLYKVKVDGVPSLVALASTGFKPKESLGKSGNSELFQFNRQGQFLRSLCRFKDMEFADSAAFHDDIFYTGVMHDGYESNNRGNGRGELYQVNGVKTTVNIVPIIESLLLN